ncbi:hypothetical protein QAD02_004717 [Eretmocerus hayati]|uniref:Uncharacterized protein n=1 Tax=Eretmocerus hayati TaxID=131215 RepID=A0ACC2NV61_9HYME|nr:hypothetical protein QAD02_004717 [Eretmocerus hayati]
MSRIQTILRIAFTLFISIPRPTRGLGPVAVIGVVSSIGTLHDFLYSFKDKYLDNNDHPQNSDNTIKALGHLELQIPKYFKKCEEGLKDLIGKQTFHGSMDKIKSYSHDISHKLKEALKIKDRVKKGKLTDHEYLDLFVTSSLTHFINENPLQKIHDIIRNDFYDFQSNLSSPFIKQYQYFGDICTTRMSPLQSINRLFQHLQLISAEFFTANVLLRNISSKYRIQDNNDETGNFYELKIYRKVFAKVHFMDTILKEKHVEELCSLGTKHRCDPNKEVQAGEICLSTLWQSCNSTDSELQCKNVETDIAVCVDETSEYPHDFYYPSNEASSKECHHKLEILKETRDSYFLRHITAPISVHKPCDCSCEEDGVYYYYNKEVTATDVKNDMVVVGAKLEVIENTLVINIKQGKLLPGGAIDPNSSSWLPVKINPMRRERLSTKEYPFVHSIDLTRAVSRKSGCVLTELGLIKTKLDNEYNWRIGLTAAFHSYNFKEGKLEGVGGCTSVAVSQSPEVEMKLVNPVVPTALENDPPTHIIRDKFVKFTTSNGVDGGRSMVPFIDGQEVEPCVLTPLSGAGLLFRGPEGSGGYIGIELITYDLVPLIMNRNDTETTKY